MTRLSFLLPLLLLGCSRPASPPIVVPPAPEVVAPKSLDAGLKSGVAFLVGRQSPDGAWRSDEYATFKDGTALTPLVLCSLQDVGDAGRHTRTACDVAADWLAAKVKGDGTLDEGPDGLPYPVYTAALTVIALSHRDCARYTRQRDAWLDYLLARQLIEQNGWKRSDTHYGGWGYYPTVPRKPKPGEAVPAQHLLESNISATRYALEALLAARPTAGAEPVGGANDFRQIRQRAVAAAEFIKTCVNPDGGAHFVANDPVRNKAGADPETKRFHSYGSATADVVLSQFAQLRLTSKPDTDPPRESLNWLRTHFDIDRHPGTYIPAHEASRNAVYFYYVAAMAKAFTRIPSGETADGLWMGKLSEALLKRQRADGSWANPLELVRENDPILATAYAVAALARCRK